MVITREDQTLKIELNNHEDVVAKEEVTVVTEEASVVNEEVTVANEVGKEVLIVEEVIVGLITRDQGA